MNKKDKPFQMRFSEQEYERIKDQAEKQGFSGVASYLRWLAHSHGIQLENQEINKNRKS